MAEIFTKTTVDQATQDAAISENKAALDRISPDAAATVSDGDIVWGVARIWEAISATATVPDPKTDAGFAADTTNWKEFSGAAQVDDTVYETGVPSGAPAAGQNQAFDVSVTPWRMYRPNAGRTAWEAAPEAGSATEMQPAWFDPANAEHATAGLVSAETLEERYLAKPIPLPATGATLEINRWYQGREGSYTIPNGTVDGDSLLIDNPSNLKGESTRALFSGKYATSSDGSIVTDDFSVSPNSRWRLYWDTTLDGGNGAWRIHSNRNLLIALDPTDDRLLLTRNNDFSLFSSAVTPVTLRVPEVPSGRIKVRLDALSNAGLRIEMEDTGQTHNVSFNGNVNDGYDFGTEYKGKEFTIEANTTTGHWIIYVDEPTTATIDPDDIADWASGETGLSQGDLRKWFDGSNVRILGRIGTDTSDAGGALPGADWQDVTDQQTEALVVVDSDAAAPTYFATYGKPHARRFEVTGSTALIMLFPSDGGTNADAHTEVYNKGTSTVTVEGQTIPAGGWAKIVADPDISGPFVWASSEDTPSGSLEREVVTASGGTFTITADRESDLTATVAGTTVTMPDLSVFTSQADARQGIIVNASGQSLAVNANGSTPILDSITTLRDRTVYAWRQTGPSFYRLYETGRMDGATATYTGAQKVAEWTGNHTVNTTGWGGPLVTNVDFTGAEWFDIHFVNSFGALGKVQSISLEQLRDSGGGAASYSSSHALRLRDVASDITNLTLQTAINPAGILIVTKIIGRADSANGFVVPAGMAVAETYTLTANSGAVALIGDTTARTEDWVTVRLTVPLGQELQSVVPSVGLATIENAKAGLVAVNAPAGTTAVDLTTTFSASSDGSPLIVDKTADAGAWVDIGIEDIQIHMGNAGDRQMYLRFTGDSREIEGTAIYTTQLDGTVTNTAERSGTFAGGSTTHRIWPTAGFNFTVVGQTVRFRFTDLETGERYLIRYTTQSNHLNNTIRSVRY